MAPCGDQRRRKEQSSSISSGRSARGQVWVCSRRPPLQVAPCACKTHPIPGPMTLQNSRQPLSLVAPSPCKSGGPIFLQNSSSPGPMSLQIGSRGTPPVRGPVGVRRTQRRSGPPVPLGQRGSHLLPRGDGPRQTTRLRQEPNLGCLLQAGGQHVTRAVRHGGQRVGVGGGLLA